MPRGQLQPPEEAMEAQAQAIFARAMRDRGVDHSWGSLNSDQREGWLRDAETEIRDLLPAIYEDLRERIITMLADPRNLRKLLHADSHIVFRVEAERLLDAAMKGDDGDV